MVQEILTDDSVWPHICEDGMDGLKARIAEMYLPEERYYVLCPAPGVLLLATPFSSVALIGHVAVSKDARGADAARAAMSAYRWIFANTAYTKIIGIPSVSNKLACMFAAITGMKPEGRISQAFRKNGELHDMLVFGITKEEMPE